MNIVLLSGGSGKRLWPLSNDVRSKQFIKIFKREDSEESGYESMLQRVYRQIKKANKDAKITIATSRAQASAIYNQLGMEIDLSTEPYRRDTFPAIVLAAAYLKDIKGVDENEIMVVCPIDPYVEDSYFELLPELEALAKEHPKELSLVGIEPMYPSTKYGYILPVSDDRISKIADFKEKPDEAIAKEYIERGALWNGGVFACRISFILEKAQELIGITDYDELVDAYEKLKKISFDYAVVEKETDMNVIRFNGEWKDLGTWSTLTETMTDSIIGNGRKDDICDNVHIINSLDLPVVALGLKDVVISTSPDGILVSDKKRSSTIREMAEEISQPVMYAEKSWGDFRVLDVESDAMTIKITVDPGHTMDYHSHERRDEVWIVLSGNGTVTVDGMKQSVRAGDVITMQALCRHTIKAEGDKQLQLIEIQLGKDISVDDKRKFRI